MFFKWETLGQFLLYILLKGKTIYISMRGILELLTKLVTTIFGH